ncbi:MAG: SDR family oxidoreductase [Actinomycetota bacterium]|nr:MAG: SDR family oxidoreductase [Actinomycetota bacterium]
MTEQAKVAIVTGASSGIGASTTNRLVRDGWSVVATSRSVDRLADLAKAHGERVLPVACDVTDWDGTQALVADAVKAYGRVDAVVANAGYIVQGDIRTADPRQWPDMVLTNVVGPAYLVRAALSELQATSGRAVLVGSVGGLRHSAGSVYSATKWAVTALAENLRQTLTTLGVAVTLVSPGVTRTGFFDEYPNGVPELSLSPDVLADTIAWALQQPPGVEINTVAVRPTGELM